MSEISCRVFEFFELHAETYGYSLPELTEGLDAGLETLQDPSERVSWEVWAEICERFEQLVGGPDETVRAGEQIIEMGFSAPVRTIGGALLSPDLVYDAVVRWLGPYFFRNLIWHIDRSSPGNLTIRIAVPDHQPASPAWFRMALGSFIKVPQAVNANDAIVSARVRGREAEFVIRCESETTLWSRLRVWMRAVFRPAQLLKHLEELQADLRVALGQAVAGQTELRRILISLPDPVAVVRDDAVLWSNSAWRSSVGEQLLLQSLLAGNVVHLDSAEQRAYEVTDPVTITWEGETAQLILLRDVTQVRQLAEHMRIADRLGALGMIAASVGHEINNPLAVALGSLDLSLTDTSLSAQTRADLERSLEALKQAAAVTSDLLTVARDSQELEVVDFNAVVQTALRLAGNELRHVPNLRVDVAVADDLRRVRGSRQRLTQVVLNLLVNAAHALVEAPADEQKISLRAANENDEGLISVCIEDNGPGIPSALLANVKEPFFTTKGRSGSGLGLAVCERIVGEHGGTIELKNLLPRGTQVTVRLPAVDALPDEKSETSPAAIRSEVPLRILIVDDQRELCDVLAAQLEPHEAVAVYGYDEALALVAEDTRFDVVLLDVMLAGSSGIALHEALPPSLRQRTVFITGGVFLQEEETDLSSQANPVLTKPFVREELLDVVETVATTHGRYQHSA